MKPILLCAALLAVTACERAAPTPPVRPRVRLTIPDRDPSAVAVEIIGLPDADLAALRRQPPAEREWPLMFRVSVAADDAPKSQAGELPPIAGRYTLTRSALAFKPAYGFDAGRTYIVFFDPSRLPPSREDAAWRHERLTEMVSRPRPPQTPSTYVDRIYPSIDVVPENQLRFYIHFSAPMGLKGGVDNVQLLDGDGREVVRAFLPLDAEFWNGDRTRYTVFFDPGRVKRGILPNEQLGRPLRRGGRYTLVISSDWTDAQGLPLREEHRHVFRVGPADMRPIDPARWVLLPPVANTRDPLAVTFSESLDHGLLQRTLGVVTSTGTVVEGKVDIKIGETRWTFVPDTPWSAGAYRLVVLTILEDLAGNRIGRPFEVDQFARTDRSAEPESIAIPFRTK